VQERQTEIRSLQLHHQELDEEVALYFVQYEIRESGIQYGDGN